MISVDIEKEIQQKNKVFLGLTLRQLLCVFSAIVCAIVMALLLSPSLSVYPSLIIGAVCFSIGWYRKDGITAEMYFLKVLKTKFYKNDKRKYRTKNKYIALINNEYRRHENIDKANKKIAKTLKKEQKRNKKSIKTTHIKTIK